MGQPVAPYALRDPLLSMAFELPGIMPPGVNPQRAFAILTAIVNRASQQRGKWVAWPSWDTIRADIGGMGKNQFGAALRALQDAGLIKRFYRGRVPAFEITLPSAPQADNVPITQKREPTFPRKGKPKEQAVSEQPNHQPNETSCSEAVSVVPVAVGVVDNSSRDQERITPSDEVAGSPPVPSNEQDERVSRQLPALWLSGLLPAVYALCRRTGADKAEILAAVEHGLTDTVHPPVDPLKAAEWRSTHINDSRMGMLRRKAEIALGIPLERSRNHALEKIQAAQAEAVPLSEGLQIMRSRCKLIAG